MRNGVFTPLSGGGAPGLMSSHERRGDMAPKTITTEQKRIIWGLAKKALKISDDTIYAMICETFGCERMSALTYAQADLFIRELRRHAAGLGPDRLTELQQRKIMIGMKDLGWTADGLTKFVKAQVGVDNVAWLDIMQARNVITAMEKIKKWHDSRVV